MNVKKKGFEEDIDKFKIRESRIIEILNIRKGRQKSLVIWDELIVIVKNINIFFNNRINVRRWGRVRRINREFLENKR